MSGTHIRWMIRADLDDVMAIENASFQFPWPEEDLIASMRPRNQIGMVAEHDGRVAGFMIYMFCKNRLELLNFAVHPDMRNKGVGSAMLDKLISKLHPERRTKLTFMISEKNTHGHLFFSRHGCIATGVVKQPYEFGYNEDAYSFEYDILNQPGAVVV